MTLGKYLLILILLATSLLSSCSKPPRLPPLPADAVILAFGDSLTFGTGAGEGESYPALLATATGRRVINAGIPGEISATGVQRLPELLEREKPALLLLCHGGNDLLQKLDRQALADNLRTMIRAAQERGVTVALLAVPSPDLSLTPPDLYENIAAEFDLPLEQSALKKILGKNSLKADYFHPNAAGYKQLAANIHELLKKSGALP